jgi:hypothetical protein
MIDQGIDKGLVQTQDDSPRAKRGVNRGFFGFRKMFRDYLTKLNVAFYDTCCPAATPEGIYPLRYNSNDSTVEFFNPSTETWIDSGIGTIPDPFSVNQIYVGEFIATPRIFGASAGDDPINISNLVITPGGATQINTTASISAGNLLKGAIFSGTIAPVTVTLPSVADIFALITPITTQGTTIQFAAHNQGNLGNALTIAVGTGMTVVSPLTGGTTMTVADGRVGIFQITLTSSTTAQLSRVA